MSRADHIAASRLGRLFRGQTAIDFYGRRRIGLIIAIVVFVVTFGSMFTRGLNLGLDFEGGQAWDVPAGETFDVDEAENILEANDVSITGSKIQTRSTDADSFVTIQIKEVPSETADRLTSEFAAAAGVGVNEVSFSFTSASWGNDITEKAVRALVIFLIVVAIFISLRFEWRMAVAALAAMVHDVVFAVGVYEVLQFEVTPATVIAFLTILGYSLYDTIVVFDRIKENEGKYASVRMPYEDIVNISMNQVMMRSINTSLSSILPVISLLLIGSGLLGAVTLREFGLALLVGMIAGVYSSIFVASPLLAVLKSKSGRTSRRERLIGDDLRAAVIGAGVSGRVLTEEPADRSSFDEHDDVARTEAVHVPAERILSHPPRPRKKKRR
ncbi:MAG: protein translocase subunit SecF [Ilumatobacter sp.]|uniref:protein translocase subunit SecF n=1 Tax=Ilumatobacter sp. TaxID=1967498 RepID=UPI00391B8046